MSVILYKGTETIRVEPRYLEDFIETGWELEKPKDPYAKKKEPKTIKVEVEEKPKKKRGPGRPRKKTTK